jgi:hypothetical protein
MRYLIFILFISCSTAKFAPRQITYCWKTTLVPSADWGGWWKIINQSPGTLPITLPAKGTVGADNPCIELGDYGCGVYVVRYYVESTTCFNCIDSSTHTLIYTDLTGFSICN